MAHVELKNLSKVFPGGVQAVHDVSLAVDDGEFMVLVGPSGCGKSTVLRLIAGLEQPSEGTILIDGRVVNRVAPRDRDIAMVFQTYALYPHMTAYDNLAFGLKLRRFPRREIRARVREAAEILGITPLLRRKPRELSGGERQRVAVGRAIVRQPKVFLFDEPLSNLDARLRVEMRAELIALQQRIGTTMVYVTHDQVEAMTMGRRIAVMQGGRLLQVADPLTLYHRPANLAVARFIGTPPMNVLRGALKREGEGLLFAAGLLRAVVPPEAAARLSARAGGAVALGLRPEDISCRPAAGASGVPARVRLVEPMGSETWVHLEAGEVRLVARTDGDTCPRPGDRIAIALDLRRACFFDPDTGDALT